MSGAPSIADTLNLIDLINAGQRWNEMDEDQEILDLLARRIPDPDLRGRIFDLLERDPATITPEERELVEQTMGGILSAETERLRADTERLQGPSWLSRFFQKRRRSEPGSAPPGRGLREMPTPATADDREDDISVRSYLRQLRWIAPGLLVGFLGLWASGVARGMSLPAALLLWAFITVALGPLIWLRSSVRRNTPGWWRALGFAMLWSLGAIALLGIGYALLMAVLTG